MKAPVIVTSTEDIAGTNLKIRLVSEWKWEKVANTTKALEILHSNEFDCYLITLEEPLVESKNLDSYCDALNIDVLCYIYASRHKSESGDPALLTHVTGNWGTRADLGGEPREIAFSSAFLLKKAFSTLLEEKEKIGDKLSEFVVNLEVTHHGPTNLKAPLIFVELGSDERNWNHPDGIVMVSNVIMKLVKDLKDVNFNFEKLIPDLNGIGIGFGGPHYAATFDRVMQKCNVSFSHIVPKYALKDITREMVEMALERTIEKVDWFVLDWKGLNREQKDVLIPILETFDVPVKRAKHLERELCKE
ncbi:MAG: D-aminoacyl-tRNA deacylase [Candidatus Hodarchaeota archaeon]